MSAPSESTLRAMLDAAPTAASVVGPDLTIRAWNAAAERMTGWTAEDVLGRFDPGVPERQRARVGEAVRAWLADPMQAAPVVQRRLRPDGTVVHLALETIRPVELEDGTGLALWFTEASDADAMLRQRNRLSRRLVGATRIEDVLPVLTNAVRDLLGATSALVLRRCPPGDHLHGLRGLGLDTEVAEQVTLDLDGDGPWEPALEGSICDGAMTLDGRDQVATFVPMGPRGDGWVLAVCGTLASSTSAALQDLFLAVADETWVALQRVELVADLDGKIEILEATNSIGSSVGLDLEAALHAVSRRSAEALSCERAAVYLCDPVDGDVTLAHVHASDATTEQLLADTEGLALAEEVVRTGREVLYQDVSACEIADGPWHVDAGTVAVMGLPMVVGARTVGALVVAHTVAAPRGFTSLCQQVGGAVAQQAAIVVEHARLFQTERSNVERLRELDRLKADWMAGVTHDLKAPLTGLLGFVETLRRMTGHVSEEQQREYLGVMSRQADQLVGLVEDLLLSARVDADAVARRRELVPVNELVERAIASLSPEQQARVTLLDDGVTTPVLGDSSHLQRVFVNLLSNAWRHGGIEVTITIGHEDGRVLVAVEDDGPGVADEDRERIFDRFVHGGHEASSGLGLYVARGIIEAHDGSLGVVGRSDGGDGARFEVRLPRGRSQREQDLSSDETVETERRRSLDEQVT